MIEDNNRLLTCVRNARIYEYGVHTLKSNDWKRNKVIVKEEQLGERYGQHIFVSAYVGPNMSAVFNVVTVVRKEVAITGLFCVLFGTTTIEDWDKM